MFRQNFLISAGKILVNLIRDIVYFPIWWYSVGFGRLVKNVFIFWRNQEKAVGFSVWAKNIFVPMYGQYDWAGRLISFIIRLVQIIARGLYLLFWLAIVLIIIIFWLAWPLLLLIALGMQFRG